MIQFMKFKNSKTKVVIKVRTAVISESGEGGVWLSLAGEGVRHCLGKE